MSLLRNGAKRKDIFSTLPHVRCDVQDLYGKLSQSGNLVDKMKLREALLHHRSKETGKNRYDVSHG